MRYFLTTDAARVTTLGGHSFEFEPVSLRGGSWLGILAVDEPAASVLAANPPASIEEVTADHYASLKKKHSATSAETPASPQRPQTHQGVAVADRVGVLTEQITAKAPVTNPNSTANISAVTLLTTRFAPPHEPLLDSTERRRKFA